MTQEHNSTEPAAPSRVGTSRGGRYWVTRNNKQWVSDATGIPLVEIERLYAEARAEKRICTIVVS